ncbi:hypothetical protein L1887_17777 [Cichorium endivia]|nr:hypothetical protein L1887_17777 [Cichorium endivia]
METRSKKRSIQLRESSPSSSSNRSQKKRRIALKKNIPSSRKKMGSPFNEVHDVALLNILRSVCTKEETSLGYKFDKPFWKRFATKFSGMHGISFTTEQCQECARHHENMCNSYQVTSFTPIRLSVCSNLLTISYI